MYGILCLGNRFWEVERKMLANIFEEESLFSLSFPGHVVMHEVYMRYAEERGDILGTLP